MPVSLIGVAVVAQESFWFRNLIDQFHCLIEILDTGEYTGRFLQIWTLDLLWNCLYAAFREGLCGVRGSFLGGLGRLQSLAGSGK